MKSGIKINGVTYRFVQAMSPLTDVCAKCALRKRCLEDKPGLNPCQFVANTYGYFRPVSVVNGVERLHVMLNKLKNRMDGTEGTGIWYDEPYWVIRLWNEDHETVEYYDEDIESLLTRAKTWL